MTDLSQSNGLTRAQQRVLAHFDHGVELTSEMIRDREGARSKAGIQTALYALTAAGFLEERDPRHGNHYRTRYYKLAERQEPAEGEFRYRRVVSPNGKARKQPIAECPRCSNDVDLKGGKIKSGPEEGETELVFKAHYDDVTMDRCPTAGMTPADAAEWIRTTRERLGLAHAA